MRSPANERGSVSAEFAVALPAVLACLALCVGAVHGVAQYAALAGSAAAGARLAARGDDPAPAALVRGSAMEIHGEGRMLCVTMTAPEDSVLSRLGVRLRARACALDERQAG